MVCPIQTMNTVMVSVFLSKGMYIFDVVKCIWHLFRLITLSKGKIGQNMHFVI